jgi:hypothetical protein
MVQNLDAAFAAITGHRPVAEQEVEVLLFEPATTLRTGD